MEKIISKCEAFIEPNLPNKFNIMKQKDIYIFDQFESGKKKYIYEEKNKKITTLPRLAKF